MSNTPKNVSMPNGVPYNRSLQGLNGIEKLIEMKNALHTNDFIARAVGVDVNKISGFFGVLRNLGFEVSTHKISGGAAFSEEERAILARGMTELHRQIAENRLKARTR